MLIFFQNKVIRYASNNDFELLGQEFVPCIQALKSNSICKLGYINHDRIILESPITIGYVKICNITFNSKRVDYNCILGNTYTYYFDYSIDIEITDKKSNTLRFSLTPTESRVGKWWNKNQGRHFLVYEILFSKLIPLINKYVENDLDISLISQESLNLFFSCDNDIPQNFESHFLEIIDKVWFSKEEDKFILTLYVSDSISFFDIFVFCICFNTVPQFDSSHIIFTITEEDSKRYIGKLYFNVLLNNFILNELYAITSIDYWQKCISPDFHLYTPSENEARICTFVKRLKGESEHVGENRVGRDDCEYDYKNIEIELKQGEDPSTELMHMINKVVGHKLEFKAFSYKDCKGTYRWHEVSNSEYVVGLACKTYDTGSYYLGYGNKLKILKEIIRVKNNDIEEYKKWTI